jgi:hypothetical protein
MPLPVEDQFPESEASASAQASGSSSSAPRPPREQPKISNPQHLNSLLDMIADGDGEEPPEDAAGGAGGIQIEDIRSDEEDVDEEEEDDEEEGKVAAADAPAAGSGKSKKKKKNKKKSKSKAVDKLK